MNDRKFHPATNVIPNLPEDEFAALKASIEHHRGLQEPIVLLGGMILDGRQRYRACQELNIEPAERVLESVNDPIQWVIEANCNRRHMTPSQLAMVGGKAMQFYESAAKERQREAGRSHGRGQVVENLPPPIDAGKARDQAGAVVGVSGKSIDAALKVLDSGNLDLVKAVENRGASVSRAAKIAAMPLDEQADAIARPRRQANATASRKGSSNALRAIQKLFDKLEGRHRVEFKKSLGFTSPTSMRPQGDDGLIEVPEWNVSNCLAAIRHEVMRWTDVCPAECRAMIAEILDDVKKQIESNAHATERGCEVEPTP